MVTTSTGAAGAHGACRSASVVTARTPSPAVTRSLARAAPISNRYVSHVGQPDSTAADRSLLRAELSLLLAGVAVVLVTAFAAGGGDVAAWERSVFRAINDLPDLLYPPVWVVMQFGSFWAIVG